MANDNWGSIARFGIFIVGNEVVPEAEWWAMAPPGISIHAARVTAPAPWATWSKEGGSVELSPDLARGAAQFAGIDLSVVTLAHSSSSIAGGAGWDEAAAAAVRSRIGGRVQVTTNGADCIAALRKLAIERPYLVFPPWFGDKTIGVGTEYFRDQGFDPVTPFRPSPGPEWTHLEPGALYANLMHVRQDIALLQDQVAGTVPEPADGIMILGTGVRCAGLIDRLEQATGLPVVTANQAGLWRCLEVAKIEAEIIGYGRLFSA